MPTFIYKIKTKAGEQTGEVDAESQDEAMLIFRRQKVQVLSIKKKSRELSFGGGGPTEKDVVVFTRQFATMIEAGLPLVQCLGILAAQAENKSFAKSIADIKSRVEKGDTFADALRKHPKIFDNLYTNMIEAGEIGGILDAILKRLAAYMEKAMALKGKVKSAMVYPTAIVSIAVIVIIFLMIFVIPTFATMFEGAGAALPLPTQIVMSASAYTKKYIVFFIPLVVVAIFLFKRFYATEKGKLVVDTFMLKVPVFGPLIQKVSVAKFTRTMGTLLASGVPIIQGLDITARTAGNKVVEGAVLSIIEEIKQGKTIAEPLEKKKVFPIMVVQMIGVGEAAGALDSMLNKIADFYDEEVDTAVEALTSLLEPALMAFLGVTVGFIVVAMYLPIFKLATLASGE
ncbi:MAG: type II secretion system F family protein [Nitrospinae bacterium]|nr:type II secretion system F family protein [Nitrospinota bacterium]